MLLGREIRCTICQNEVIEDESAVNAKDARTLLAKFNEQIQQLYDLLRECEDVKLAPELMEPEPIDIKASSRSRSNKPAQDGDKWSGDATRYKTAFNYTEGSINVTMNEEQRQVKEATKEQPIWMTQSTVDGVPLDTANEVAPDVSGSAKKESGAKTEVNREIENLLMIHEKKSGGVNLPAIPLAGDTAEDSNSSDSDAEPSRPQINHQAEGLCADLSSMMLRCGLVYKIVDSVHPFLLAEGEFEASDLQRDLLANWT
ncbi:T2EA-like protein [Mya arenaria]|uniref:T2EA-like protein n=1 Tax=Mya arenaria TaxID=6604 RepID=A0ABY7EH59_MYAAR|nr:T2EA-like protein [Mya arenaria]